MKALILIFLLFGSSAYAAEMIRADHIKVSWLAPEVFGEGTEQIGILFEPDPEWHIYWKNPGDSGTAPKFKFEGAKVSGPLWPRPERMPYGSLTNLGYKGAVAFPFTVESGEDFKLSLEWLVCKEECIPGFGTLTLKRPRSSQVKWNQASKTKLETYLRRVPVSEGGPWQITETKLDASALRVTVSGVVETPEIYPIDGNFLLPTSPQVTVKNGMAEYVIPIVKGSQTPPSTGFVLALGDQAREFVGITVGAKPSTDSSIFVLLAFAFLGGVLLNLMPCVFPVISIKLFSLMKSHASSSERLREGGLYFIGAVFTFTLLGAALLVARSLGNNVGWGFQLQSPSIVLALIALFFMMGLNFIGAFEMGSGLMSLAGRYHGQGGRAFNAFATGVLSVFVAAPCTGPFMGSALGAAATLPSLQALLLFIFLGAGLGAPFLILAMSPKLMALLPKPGPWMEKLKEFLAFPLFATVLWLAWVLSLQTGGESWFEVGGLLLALSFAVWFAKFSSRWFAVLAWLIGIAALAWSVQRVQISESSAAAATVSSKWAPYNKTKIDEAIASGRAVFIDFTAAWCITCQVNKKAVLETEEASKIFSANDVYLVRADWTKQDPAITGALAGLGRNSVPVYAFYAKGKSEAQILPQILTMSMINDLFLKQEEK